MILSNRENCVNAILRKYRSKKTSNKEEFLLKTISIQEIFEHGIFHGVTNYKENKPLNIKNKNGLFTIEWE